MWDVLGIAPTEDEKAIRRAYAARLRALDPDKEPAAFQRLRAAYEGALRFGSRRRTVVRQTATQQTLAQQTGAVPELADVPQLVATPELARPTPPRPPAPPPGPSAEDRERAETARQVNEALQQNNPRRALELFEGALARGLVRLGEREPILEGIMRKVVEDQTTAPQDFIDLVQLAGWNRMPQLYEPPTPSRMPAFQRAEAERWYLTLRKQADRKLRWGQFGLDERREIHGARLVADGKWFAHITSAGFRPARRWIEQARRYAPAIGFRFPPGRLEWAEREAKRASLWRKVRVVVLNTIKALFLLAVVGIGIASAGTGFLLAWFLFGRFGFRGYFSSWKD